MVFKKLKIKQFGKIKRFEISFHEQLTAIFDADTEDIIKAIGLATGNKSLIGNISINNISDSTHIVLELEIAGIIYLITVRGQLYGTKCRYGGINRANNTAVDVSLILRNIRLCEEEESLIYYRYDPKNFYAERFAHYKDPDKYYPYGDFQKRINGTGITRSFRAYMAEYIRKYETSDFLSFGYKIKLCQDGRFIGCGANIFNSVTDSDDCFKKLFDYKCYLDVNDFWSGFEDIRDMNHEKWPMIVNSEDFNGHPGFKELFKKSNSGRQLIIINTSEKP